MLKYARLADILNTFMEDKNFVEYVVKALVDSPDDVRVERKVDEMGVLITLDINPDDMGKVIGRQGNTAKALRTLLRVVGMKHNARVNLKINEPEGGRKYDTSGSSDSDIMKEETKVDNGEIGSKDLDTVLAELNNM